MKKQITAALVLVAFAFGMSGCTNIVQADTASLNEEIAELEILLDERTSDLEMKIEDLESENEGLRYELKWLEWELDEEICSFQSSIADLMYDHEYKVVETLLDYHRDAVEAALEAEFGTKDLNAVIDYLAELSQTVTGTCEICGKPVYADEFYIPSDGINCAHYKCIWPDYDNRTAQIKKD